LLRCPNFPCSGTQKNLLSSFIALVPISSKVPSYLIRKGRRYKERIRRGGKACSNAGRAEKAE